MRCLRLGPWSLWVMGALACASAKPAKESRPPLEVVADTPEEEPAPVEPERVETPDGVDLVLYVNSPSGLVRHAAELYGDGPLSNMLESEALLELLPFPGGARLVDPDAPVQVAVVDVTEDERVAVSFGVKPGYLRDDLSEAFEVSRRLPDARVGSGDRPVCFLHATADNRERLVCSDHGETVRRLGPYMKRSALNRYPVDVRLEFTRGFIDKSAKQALQEADLDVQRSHSEALGERAALELFDSLGATAIELSLGKQGIKLALDAEVSLDGGFLNTVLVGDAARAMPPTFDKLPEDAGFAFTSAGVNRTSMARASQSVWQAIEADLNKEQPAALVERAMPVLKRALLTGGSLRFALGAPMPDPQGKVREPWWCVALEEPLDLWTSSFREAEQIDRARSGKRAGKVPKKNPDKSRLTFGEQPMGTKALPKGSMYLVVRDVPAPGVSLAKPPRGPAVTTTHVYVTTDGAATFIVGSEDKKVALDTARHFVEFDGRSKAAEFFRAEDYDSARVLGFVTPRGAALTLGEGHADAVPVDGMLNQLPKRGAAPVHFAYTVAGKDPRRARFEVQFERDLVLAVVKMILAFGATEIMQGVP